MAVTLTADVIVPEVLADIVEADFAGNLVIGDPRNRMTFVNDELLITGGNTVKIPNWDAIADLESLTENTALVPVKISQSSAAASVNGYGKMVDIDDFALLAMTGDVNAELARQFSRLVARKLDAALITEAETTGLSHTVAASISVAAIIDALAKFGDSQADVVGIILHSKQWGDLLQSADFKDSGYFGEPGGISLQSGFGARGTILGHPVYVSDRVTVNTVPTPDEYTALIVKERALGLFYRRRPQVEIARLIASDDKFQTRVSVNVFAAVHAYLDRDPDPVVKLVTQ